MQSPALPYCSWRQMQFSSATTPSPYLNTARSVAQREIASDALSAKVV
jgi:hypothetical protein